MRSRLAFLHVPKSAGVSLKSAVSGHVRPEQIAPWFHGTVLYGGFDRFDELPDATRAGILVADGGELAPFDVVMGHFALSTLEQAFDRADVATVLREPRTRLFSHYTFWRSWDPAEHDEWTPYDGNRRAVELSWAEFVDDRRIAAQIDNVVTRMLLAPHPLIPPDDFIDVAHHDSLAHEALQVLSSLGFVGAVEQGPALWAAVSAWIGADVDESRHNVTASQSDVDWSAAMAAPVWRALGARTAIDATLWASVVAAPDDPAGARALADATFVRKIVHDGIAQGERLGATSRQAEVDALASTVAAWENSRTARLTLPLRRLSGRLARR